MISQLQSIRSFVDNKLSDLVMWKDCIGEPGGNADHASAVIPIKGRRYRISVVSAYIRPAHGEITMTDLQDHHEIRGGKSDAVWDEVLAYIRRRMTDAPEPLAFSVPAEPPKPVPTYPDDRVPYLGQGITFITERGEPIGGMTELAALVTEIISPTLLSLTVFPKTGETFWRDNVPRRNPLRERNCWDFSEPAPILVVEQEGRQVHNVAPVAKSKKKAAA